LAQSGSDGAPNSAAKPTRIGFISKAASLFFCSAAFKLPAPSAAVFESGFNPFYHQTKWTSYDDPSH
jgi:hypothetical protein